MDVSRLRNKRKLPPDVSNYSRFILEHTRAVVFMWFVFLAFVCVPSCHWNEMNKSHIYICRQIQSIVLWLSRCLCDSYVRVMSCLFKSKNRQVEKSKMFFDTKLATKNAAKFSSENRSVCHLSRGFFISLDWNIHRGTRDKWCFFHYFSHKSQFPWNLALAMILAKDATNAMIWMTVDKATSSVQGGVTFYKKCSSIQIERSHQ